jgi:hypothetical protein
MRGKCTSTRLSPVARIRNKPLTIPCQSSCFSSFWETATPTPTAFCDSKANLEPCISSACGADSKFTSYSSRRSSLCSEYSSCSSTGTYTYTYKTPDGPWSEHWGTKTWPTGEVVYTGCPWSGDGWGFPFWGGLGYGPDFWDNMGPGWAHTTVTTTVTSATAKSVVTLEQAVSGTTTTYRTLGLAAQETGPTNTPNAAPTGSMTGVKVMGAALGAVVVGVGML